MSRMFAPWGVALAALACAGLSSGQDKAADDPGKVAEEQLAAKDLHRSAAMYVARGEDEVKKASDAAELRLKEYRLAVARERGAVQDLMTLTKQRDALKQQIDQTMPTIKAQVQALQQQQAAIRMQAGAVQGGRNRYGRMAGNQIQAQGVAAAATNAQTNNARILYLQEREQNAANRAASDAMNDVLANGNF